MLLCKIFRKIYSDNTSGKATNIYGRLYDGETMKLVFPAEWQTA